MNIKIVIFAIISALLVTAIYSSSKPFVYAEVSINCYYSTDKTRSLCSVFFDEDKDPTVWDCKRSKDGKNWTCVQMESVNEGSSSISPELSDAIVKAQDAIKEENTTGPQKDLGRLNDDGLSTKGADEEGVIDEGGNESTSERVVPSKDRFCKEGTGGETGKTCIPCDPGLPLGVACIDILTGGPLDMPETATSESEENNTKGQFLNPDIPELKSDEK